MVYNLRLNIWWNPNGTWVILFHTENPDIVPRVNYRIKNSTRLPEETGRRTNSIWRDQSGAFIFDLLSSIVIYLVITP